jgi:hypothetical protein
MGWIEEALRKRPLDTRVVIGSFKEQPDTIAVVGVSLAAPGLFYGRLMHRNPQSRQGCAHVATLVVSLSGHCRPSDSIPPI